MDWVVLPVAILFGSMLAFCGLLCCCSCCAGAVASEQIAAAPVVVILESGAVAPTRPSAKHEAEEDPQPNP
jgi:hypothetical protein